MELKETKKGRFAKNWHKKQWDYLIQAIKQGKMSHAFIFSGKQGLGKKQIAIALLSVLNKNKKLIPPDFIEIAPEKGLICLYQIQTAQKQIALKPFNSDFKAVLINEAETMNQEAQNCLLKTLENPPAKTLFLLLTSQKGLLLQTIVSRCQELKFFPLALKQMEKIFLSFKKESDFSQILSLSEGLPEKALSFLENRALFQEQLRKTEFVKKVLRGNLLFRFNLSKKIFKDNKEHSFDFASFSDELLGFLRQFLFQGVFSDELFKKTAEKTLELQFLSKNYNINKRLAFEALMLQLPLIHRQRARGA